MTSRPGDDTRPLDTAEPSGPLLDLLEVLSLTPVDRELGRDTDAAVLQGQSVHIPTGRVYGGQVLAQSLMAAASTMAPGRLPHSLHGYFLRPGDIHLPVTFGVEVLHDGGSFSTRRTHAYQRGTPILSMISSFQEVQPGLDHQDQMPQVPAPDDVTSALDTLGPIDLPMAQFWSNDSAFDMRHVGGSLYLGPGSDLSPRQAVWVRSRGHVPTDDQTTHRAMMAYACDQIMLEPALRRAGASWITPGLSIASLDHAMWWHRDVRVDEWLLFVQSSPSAQGGRALGQAKVFAADGTMVASIAQEAMLRLPAPDPAA